MSICDGGLEIGIYGLRWGFLMGTLEWRLNQGITEHVFIRLGSS
jgi:hypothetical protein